MILVLLHVNGITRYEESPDKGSAEEVAKRWLAEAKKSFPNKTFTPVYYAAERMDG